MDEQTILILTAVFSALGLVISGLIFPLVVYSYKELKKKWSNQPSTMPGKTKSSGSFLMSFREYVQCWKSIAHPQ